MNSSMTRPFGLILTLALASSFTACFRKADPEGFGCKAESGCPAGYVCLIDPQNQIGKCCREGTPHCNAKLSDAGYSDIKGGTGIDSQQKPIDGSAFPPDGPILLEDGNAPYSISLVQPDAQSTADIPQTQPATDPSSPSNPIPSEPVVVSPQDLTKAKNGEACLADGDCQGGHCVDQICCDKTCTESCFSCKKSLTGKADGECAPVASGKKDSHNSCVDETTKNECGNDGFCDGAGSCRKVGTDHVCSLAVCTGTLFSPTITCNGQGACKTVVPVDCGVAGCDKVDGCRKTCTDNTHCSATAYCNVDVGKCSEKKIDGESCKVADECQSKFCVDGVCCSTACQEKCKACSQAFTGQKSGTCLPVKLGDDPHDSCAEEPGCGNDGTCNGAGDCQKRGADTICSPAICTADNKFSFAAGCNGKGLCQAPKIQDCLSITCDSKVGCPSKCTLDANCESGNYCKDGTCAPKLGIGKECTLANECVSGNCVEGVCCNEKCNAACFSCKKSLNGKAADGTCAAVLSGKKDVRNSCEDTLATTNGCGQDGTCNGNGGCKVSGKGTHCGPASCNATGDFIAASTCNGEGLCKTPAPDDCGVYPCTTSGCQRSCTTDLECGGDTYCAKPNCVTKLGLGKPCGTNNNACASNNCVAGTCCKTTCPVSASKPCGFTGQCDLSGNCENAATTVQCDASKCTGSSYTPAKHCDGIGACASENPSACPNNMSCASTSECRTGACTKDTDCGAARCSINGLCESCSGLNQPCCKAGTVCASGSTCNGEICVSCGTIGKACCADKICSTGICQNGTCMACGGANQPCCESGAECGNGLACDGGKCISCGSIGKACCANSACTSGVCQNGICASCGGVNQPCCSNNFCSTGYSCNAGTCKQKNGSICSQAGQCASGFCVDGYCCDSACSSKCVSCKLANKLGICSDEAFGQNFADCPSDGDCIPGGCLGSSGACRPASKATTEYYYDGDGDGWGVSSKSIMACVKPEKYSEKPGDPHDGNFNLTCGGPNGCGIGRFCCQKNISEGVERTQCENECLAEAEEFYVCDPITKSCPGTGNPCSSFLGIMWICPGSLDY